MNHLDNVYVWRTLGTDQGLLDGRLDKNKVGSGLFESSKNLQDAYFEWRNFKGVRRALEGNHDDKEFSNQVLSTVNWVESGCEEPIKAENYSEECLNSDVLMIVAFASVVSQRVVNILDQEQVNYEKYSMKFDQNTANQFYAINILDSVTEEDFFKTGLGSTLISRLHFKDGFKRSLVLISSNLARAFQEGGIRGFRYVKYLENPYAE